MYDKRRRKENYELTFTLFSIILIIYYFSRSNTHTKTIRSTTTNAVTVAVITSHRAGAFYLPDVVKPFDNVVIFNTAQYHKSLEGHRFDRSVSIESIWDGEYDYDNLVPHKNLKTDVHKTKRYNNVNVVKTEKRKRWWRKQNQDFLKVARNLREKHRSSYYLILEDDNVYNNAMPLDDTLAQVKTLGPIVHMGVGMGALFISDAMLESFIGYMSLRADVMPVDWMVEMFIESLGIKMIHKNAFKHVGGVSTKPDQVPGMF